MVYVLESHPIGARFDSLAYPSLMVQAFAGQAKKAKAEFNVSFAARRLLYF
jgi:hypothetical protein